MLGWVKPGNHISVIQKGVSGPHQSYATYPLLNAILHATAWNLPIIFHVSIVKCEAEGNPPIIFHILFGSVTRRCGTHQSYFTFLGGQLRGCAEPTNHISHSVGVSCEAVRNPPIIFHILWGSVARLCGTNQSYSMSCLAGAKLNKAHQSYFCGTDVKAERNPTNHMPRFYCLVRG
jgi:hypothetical protein